MHFVIAENRALKKEKEKRTNFMTDVVKVCRYTFYFRHSCLIIPTDSMSSNRSIDWSFTRPHHV